MSSSSLPSDVGPSTRLVHGGVERSQFGEACEALYLTQGFVYASAEAAEARFAGEEEVEGYVYSRYGNPTVTMFQDRMALLEGAEAARATASGMAAVTAAMVACACVNGATSMLASVIKPSIRLFARMPMRAPRTMLVSR